MNGLDVIVTTATLAIDLGILYYVRREYVESRELNQKLEKVYRSKKRKVNATQLVKAVVAQEVG